MAIGNYYNDVPIAEIRADLIGHPLAARQRQVYDFIYTHTKECGFQPSVSEVGEHLGVRSRNGCVAHIKALIRKGYVAIRPGQVSNAGSQARALRFLKRPDGEPFQGFIDR